MTKYKLAPVCPQCGLHGKCQRRKRGRWYCLECGKSYTKDTHSEAEE